LHNSQSDELKNMAMSPAELKTKNCVADSQQQFTGLIVNRKNRVMDPTGPKTKNDCAGEGQQQFNIPYQTRPRHQLFISYQSSAINGRNSTGMPHCYKVLPSNKQ
jgi:hypothetical protein